MFQRVRVRLTLITVALFVLLYALSSAAIYAIVRHQAIINVDQNIRNIARRVETNGQLPTARFVYVYAQIGNAVITNAPRTFIHGMESLASRHSTSTGWFTNWIGPDSQPYRVYSLPQSPGGGSYQVLIAEDMSQQLGVLIPLERVMLLVGIAGSLIAAGAGFVWAGRALHPIRTAWDKQLRFVSDASHELRTPLAVIQSNLDLVLDHADQTVEDNLEWVGNAQSEARRLARLVHDLLTLARSDAQTAPLQISSVAVADVVRRVVDMFEPVADMQGLELKTGDLAEATVRGDKDRLLQLIVILVDNACKYTGSGGHVTVSTAVQKNHVLLRVADDGPGIDSADLPHVFDRFYRADKARARGDDQGTGLGLSIAQWIADAHHGKIHIDSRPGAGTTVTVSLPIAA